MGKHEKFSPKAIANKIKSTGLQKCRWYCQMCEKQCRDQNGFKCHATSEAHQRQLLLFGENPNQFLGSFSGEFEKGFMEILRRQYRNLAEYIKHKEHIHMNSTKWLSLTGFCLHLRKSGKAEVDGTEKGWFIKYVERDSKEMERQEAIRKRMITELDEEERSQKFVAEQVDRAMEETTVAVPQFSEIRIERSEEEKIAFSFASVMTENSAPPDAVPSTTVQPSSSLDLKNISQCASLRVNALEIATVHASSTTTGTPMARSSASSPSSRKRKGALEEIKEEEEQRKRQRVPKTERSEYWLCKNIVKLISERLGESFRNRKGIEVFDRHTAMVQILDSEIQVKFDDVHLQTVIPALHKTVIVVNGAHRGEQASLELIDEAEHCATIRLTTGRSRGHTVKRVKYEDISKLHRE